MVRRDVQPEPRPGASASPVRSGITGGISGKAVSMTGHRDSRTTFGPIYAFAAPGVPFFRRDRGRASISRSRRSGLKTDPEPLGETRAYRRALPHGAAAGDPLDPAASAKQYAASAAPSFVPADIEGGELREELQLAVGQVVVDPPRHCLPRHAVGRVGRRTTARRSQAIAPMPPSASRRSQMWRGASCARSSRRSGRCALPYALTARRAVGGADRRAARTSPAAVRAVPRRGAAAGARSPESRIVRQVAACRRHADLAVQEIAHTRRNGDSRTRPSCSAARTDLGALKGRSPRLLRRQTLKRKCMTSPSCTTYRRLRDASCRHPSRPARRRRRRNRHRRSSRRG